jgi:hypothetical protein
MFDWAERPSLRRRVSNRTSQARHFVCEAASAARSRSFGEERHLVDRFPPFRSWCQPGRANGAEKLERNASAGERAARNRVNQA